MTSVESFHLIHRQAIQAHFRNEFELAINLYKQCLTLQPASASVRQHLGLLLIQNGHIELGNRLVDESKMLNVGGAVDSRVEHNLRAVRGAPEAKIATDLEFDDISARYQPFASNTVGDWRHRRMLEFASAFAISDASWLTIGDHYGHDARRLRFHGISNITVSSLSTVALEEAFRREEVEKFLSLNAEHISLSDDSFDYVVCKESLHHMPRPFLAIYEMLRIARKGIFFIEPSDPLIDWTPNAKGIPTSRECFRDSVVGSSVRYKTAAGETILEKYTDWWEDGPFNYVYTLSKREVKKIALGHGLPAYGTIDLNDFYHADWNNGPCIEGAQGFEDTKKQIRLYDQLCQNTGIPYNYVVGMLFKQTPSPGELQLLTALGANVEITRTRFLALQMKSE